MQSFKTQVEKALEKASGKTGVLSKPPSLDLGDIASNVAFTLPGNPVENAGEIAKKIKPTGLIKQVRVAGPYINFFADHDKMSKQVVETILKEKEKYGKGKNKKEKVLIEYSNPNTHKAVHIGHLRNIALGLSLTRILDHAGYKAIPINYINDKALHVAKTLWAYNKFYKKMKPPENKGKWLGQIYTKACQELKANPESEQEVRELLKKLEHNDKSIMPLWKQTRKWSLDEFNRIYKELGAKFVKDYFESDIVLESKDIVQEILKKKIAKIDDGAVIVKNPSGVNILQRNDGTTLYAAVDLALAKHKFKDFKPDRNVYVVGSEQKYHFQMLFETLQKMKFKNADKCYHLAYELVMLKQGKMKSREGEVILYEDFADKAYELALNAVNEKNPGLSEKKKNEIAHDVSIGAMLYSMIHVSNNKVIHFDWDVALDFNRESAPYIQYSFARANSILKKSKKKPKPGSVPEAIGIITKLAEFPDVVEQSAEAYSPHLMAGYAFTLAKCFNDFYEKSHVIGSKNEAALLAVVKSYIVVMQNTLYLLGVPATKEM